jgi:hypothetical protein
MFEVNLRNVDGTCSGCDGIPDGPVQIILTDQAGIVSVTTEICQECLEYYKEKGYICEKVNKA